MPFKIKDHVELQDGKTGVVTEAVQHGDLWLYTVLLDEPDSQPEPDGLLPLPTYTRREAPPRQPDEDDATYQHRRTTWEDNENAHEKANAERVKHIREMQGKTFETPVSLGCVQESQLKGAGDASKKRSPAKTSER